MADVTNEEHKLVNWGAVATNVIGLLLGAAALGTLSGVGYMVITIPRNQDKILENQRAAQAEQIRINTRLDRLEVSDERQNQAIFNRNNP